MIDRYRDGIVPAGIDLGVEAADNVDLAAYSTHMSGENGYLLHEALKAVWRTVARANEFVDRQAPWKLAADPAMADELNRTLGSLVRQLVRQTVYIAPFMPSKSQDLWERLGAPGNVSETTFDAARALDPTGWKVRKGDPLFPKEAR
jgi:methionyl-tRNA synthetase